MHMKKTNRPLARVILGVVAASVLVGAATPAAAAPAPAAPEPLVANLTRVQATSPSSSVNKSVTVACPAGLVVYGPGGQLTGGVGNVVLDAIIPSLTTVTARGTENGAYAGNWTVTAYAVCGARTTNHQLIRITSASNATPQKTAQAGCPGGTNVFGLGFAITGGNGLIFPDRVVPSGPLTNALVRATRDADSTTSLNWSVAAYALCANPAPGLERASEGSLATSTSPKSVTPTCSSGRLHGLGGEHTAPGNAIIDDLTPNSALTGATVTVYENPPNFAGNWAVTGHAICAL